MCKVVTMCEASHPGPSVTPCLLLMQLVVCLFSHTSMEADTDPMPGNLKSWPALTPTVNPACFVPWTAPGIIWPEVFVDGKMSTYKSEQSERQTQVPIK